jgi:hypothetical protein
MAVDNNDTEWLLLTGSKERTGSIKPAGVAKLKAKLTKNYQPTTPPANQ